MERQWAAHVTDGQEIDDVYRVADCAALRDKYGSPYLKLTLADASGDVAAVRFRVNDAEAHLARELCYARVRGRVDPPKGQYPRCIVLHEPLEAVEEPTDPSAFVPCSELPISDLRARLERHIASVRDPHLSTLLRAVFDDPKVRAPFESRPAARKMHHAWRHGLLEHTLEVADAAAAIADAQKTWSGAPISRDLVVTGALLHDIGKIDEIQESDGDAHYSEQGSLLGHITLGIVRIGTRIGKIEGFPPRLRWVLLHLIQSHHGKPEWGSPVPPMTPEAVVLHYADLLTVRIRYVNEARQEAGDGLVVDQWKLEGSPRFHAARVFTGDYGLEEREPTVAAPFAADLPLLFSPGEEMRLPRLPILRLLGEAGDTGGSVFGVARLPLVGRIAAGVPILAAENVDGYHAVESGSLSHDGEHFLLQVSGDSMTGDGIVDGDLIVVRRQDEGGPDDILVVLVDDEATVKRVRRTPDGRALLQPSNPAHSPIPVAPDAAVHIRGKVVGIAR